MQVKTSDIYQGAYILTRGGFLDHLELENRRGRPAVIFTGTGVEELAREFESGRATANVSIFRGFLDRLKDQMFAALREDKKESQAYGKKKRNG